MCEGQRATMFFILFLFVSLRHGLTIALVILGTHYVDQAGLKLTELTASWSAGIKAVCPHCPALLSIP